MPVASPMPEAIRFAAQTLPPSARIFARLQTLLHDPRSSIDDIVDLVRLDAGLASAVLRVANSAFHRKGEPLGSVNDAINRVGLREVHRIVGVAVSGQLFIQSLPLYRLGGQTLWQNSLATATAMGLLARAAGEDERAAYTIGLLRSAGRLVLQRLSGAATQPSPPAPEASAPLGAEVAWERACFGFTNHELSAWLLGEWRFAPALCAALRHHPDPEREPGDNRLGALLHLACWIATELGKGLPAEQRLWHQSEGIAARADLSAESVGAVLLDTRGELNRLEGLLAQPISARD
jgi:HD-like signal output (HDOD) protein